MFHNRLLCISFTFVPWLTAAAQTGFVETEFQPDVILHTHRFLEGANTQKRHMNSMSTLNLKFAFQGEQGTAEAELYGDCHQGVGVAKHWADELLGSPVSLYLFQGARLARFGRNVSLNYEWKLGLTTGWETYDLKTNPYNMVFGSTTTALMNAAFYMNWHLSDHIDLNAGVSATHFSNGNTKYPNGGLNTVGAKVGAAYYLRPVKRIQKNGSGQEEAGLDVTKNARSEGTPMSYDLMVFGAWCVGGYQRDDGVFALPGARGVYGLNAAALYNVNHLFAAGLSLDAVYDRSANLKFDYSRAGRENHPFSGDNQFALGASARVELTMPYFSINGAIGTNFINAKGDFSGIYEMLTLKVNLVKTLYLNIGYKLHDFQLPDHLMLGLGFRLGYHHTHASTFF